MPFKSGLSSWLAVIATASLPLGVVHAGSVTYAVSDSGQVDCTTPTGYEAHRGLTTNRFRVGGGSVVGSCAQYYGFDSSSTLEVSDDEARLSATATNPYGVTAAIDFSFVNPSESTSGSEDWTLYRSGTGKIDISSDYRMSGLLFRVVDSFSLDLANDSDFEFGVGANKESGALGASGRLDIEQWTRKTIVYEWDTMDKLFKVTKRVWSGFYDLALGDHWDIKMELSAVPLPNSLILFIAGLAVLAGFNSRKRRTSAGD